MKRSTHVRVAGRIISESQNAANNTYFSHDRFSDQSEKLRETPQEHRKPSNKPATPPETTASPTANQTSEGTQIPPNRSHVNSRKLHFTEQKSKRTVENAKTPNKSQANSKLWFHQHTTTQKIAKTSKNSRCGWEQVLHGPTVGA